MLKKLSCALLAFVLSLSLAACGPLSAAPELSGGDFSLSQVEEYAGEPYVEVNDNVPYFTDEDLTTQAFEWYSPLDGLGRCGTAYANICLDLMPTEERGEIGMIRPTGWHTVRYNGVVDGNYLYNRCHLIGFQLAGENANEKNLITGTRYLNVEAMLPFENLVNDYVDDTGNHVLYRVTPVFEGDDLLASGVLMEGYSVEDEGQGICFCVYCYNVQPGVEIDYATGESWESGQASSAPEESQSSAAEEARDYVLNTSSHKFHLPSCSSVETMSEKNREDYHGTREELLAQGYEPCGSCNP